MNNDDRRFPQAKIGVPGFFIYFADSLHVVGRFKTLWVRLFGRKLCKWMYLYRGKYYIVADPE